MAKKYYEEIDILKGLAITMVILGHAIIRYPINLHEVAWTHFLYDFVEIIHMPLFFLVAGYCYSYHGDYRSFIIRKIKRLVIPYVVFNLIDCVPRELLSFLVNRPRPILESLSTMILNGGEYWFLYSLFMMFLIFPLIEMLTKKQGGKIIAIVIGIIIRLTSNLLPEIFLIRRTSIYFLYFFVGYCLKESFNIESTKNLIKQNVTLSTGITIFLWGGY